MVSIGFIHAKYENNFSASLQFHSFMKEELQELFVELGAPDIRITDYFSLSETKRELRSHTCEKFRNCHLGMWEEINTNERL